MTYSSEVLADTPEAYYRLDGTSMDDSSGNSRTGRFLNSITTQQSGLLVGDSDRCIDLNGFNSYFDFNTAAAWMKPTSITLEAVIRPTGVSGGRTLANRDDGSSDRNWIWWINASQKLEFTFWTSTSGPFTATGATSLSVNTIYHVAATYDGSNAYVYLNGSQDGTVAQSGTLRAGTIAVLCGTLQGGSAWFLGKMDEVAFYSTALSSTRIGAHYTASITAPPSKTWLPQRGYHNIAPNRRRP